MTALTGEQGGVLVRSLRQEYEDHTGGGGGGGDINPVPPELLQEIMTTKYRKVTEEFDGDSLGDSLTYSIASEDDRTIGMLKTLTLKGTHFLDLMNFFESEENTEDNFFEDLEEPPSQKVVDPWTQTMDRRYIEETITASLHSINTVHSFIYKPCYCSDMRLQSRLACNVTTAVCPFHCMSTCCCDCVYPDLEKWNFCCVVP